MYSSMSMIEYSYSNSIVVVKYFFTSMSTEKCTWVQVWVRVLILQLYSVHRTWSWVLSMSTSTSTDKCTGILQLYICSQVLFHEYEYEYEHRKMYKFEYEYSYFNCIVCIILGVEYSSWVLVRVQTNVLEYEYKLLQLYSCSQVLFHEYEYECRKVQVWVRVLILQLYSVHHTWSCKNRFKCWIAILLGLRKL